MGMLNGKYILSETDDKVKIEPNNSYGGNLYIEIRGEKTLICLSEAIKYDIGAIWEDSIIDCDEVQIKSMANILGLNESELFDLRSACSEYTKITETNDTFK